MALLVNYEGTYLPPNKLWYLVDGTWKEVITVFENPVQQEIALIDANRIKQDQVVNGLMTKQQQLMAQIDGSDPTIPMTFDPVEIESIMQQVEVIDLQLNVAKTEQVVLTKKLFEQKAQMEYLRLISEGEMALKKIAATVDNPTNWGVIRIAPQSTLDERLEVVIQSGMPTNERIFNYGLVYYRLYRKNSTEAIDDIVALQNEYLRRLDKVSYDLGREPTNYIITFDDIQPVYIEVNQFVNSGAKRIEDYLANIRDQQKYILDNIELAKAAMTALQIKADEGLIPVVDNKIITLNTEQALQVPLGSALLDYQSVTSFDQLVSTQTIQQIASGSLDINDYPGIVKVNQEVTALNEKIVAVQDFSSINNAIQNKLVSNEIVFNLEAVNILKLDLVSAQDQFWNTVLGSTTLSNSGGTTKYTQTYTSGGMYRFKPEELVILSTTISYIINVAETNKDTLTLLVSGGSNNPKIISVVNGNVTITEDIKVELSADQTKIISVVANEVQNLNVSSNLTYQSENPYIISVKENTVYETDGVSSEISLSSIHPDIISAKETNKYEFNPSEFTVFEAEEYANAYFVIQFNDMTTVSEIPFNTTKMPLGLTYNDNIVEVRMYDTTNCEFSFNTTKMPLELNNDYIVGITENNESSFSFNTTKMPLGSANDYIVSFNNNESKIVEFSFNTQKVKSYQLNGYAHSNKYNSTGLYSGFEIITFSEPDFYYPEIHTNGLSNYSNIIAEPKSNDSIISQTGLKVLEQENLNISNVNVNEIYITSSKLVNVLDPNTNVNSVNNESVSVTDNTLITVLDTNLYPTVNKGKDVVSMVIQTKSNTDTSTIIVNKNTSDNKVPTVQTNTGVVIS